VAIESNYYRRENTLPSWRVASTKLEDFFWSEGRSDCQIPFLISFVCRYLQVCVPKALKAK
jgi:hypothetical protein